MSALAEEIVKAAREVGQQVNPLRKRLNANLPAEYRVPEPVDLMPIDTI